MMPEEEAKIFLDRWVFQRRENNPSGKIELRDVSNWVEKRSEIDPNCPGLNSFDGIFLFFCLGSLLSFGGGSYKGRVTEMKNKYGALLSRNYGPFSGERKARFSAIEGKVNRLRDRFGNDLLRNWWDHKKELHNDQEKAAKAMLKEIYSWTFHPPSGRHRHLFTVKAIWIAREFHANKIWPDFPVKLCCVPDSRVRDVLVSIYSRPKYKELFGQAYSDSRFNLDVAISMSKKIWELISQKRIDGYYPYDLPFWRLSSQYA